MAQRETNEFAETKAKDATASGCAAAGCLGAGGVSVALFVILASISFTAPSCDFDFTSSGSRRNCTRSSSRLVRATTRSNIKALRRYLDDGDDPDELDDDDNRPLACAAMMGNLPAVEALLAAKADPELRGDAGGRPIVAAISGDGRESNDSITDTTTRRGPEETSTESDEGVYEPLYSEDRLDIVSALVEHGVDPTPALAPAVDLRSVDAVERLLDLGADPDGEEGRATPLTTAAMIVENEDLEEVGKDHEIIDLLLDAHADPDEGGHVDGTRIAFALPRRIREGVTWVSPSTTTTRPAPTSSTTPNMTTAVPVSTWRDRTTTTNPFQILGGPGSGPVPPLVAAAISGDTWAVKRLLDAGADPNVRAITHYTPLWAAVVARSDESIDLLLAAGADPRPEVPEVATPIWVANDDGDMVLVERLLQAPRPR